MTDERLVKALAKQIEEHDLDPRELVLVPREELEDLEYTDESETEELADTSPESPSKKEELESQLRIFRMKRTPHWDRAADRIEEELESLENEDGETEELANPSPKAVKIKEKESEDSQEKGESPRQKLESAFSETTESHETQEITSMSKSPLAEARQSNEDEGELESLSKEDREKAEALDRKIRFYRGRKRWEHLAQDATTEFEELTGVSHNDAHL